MMVKVTTFFIVNVQHFKKIWQQRCLGRCQIWNRVRKSYSERDRIIRIQLDILVWQHMNPDRVIGSNTSSTPSSKHQMVGSNTNPERKNCWRPSHHEKCLSRFTSDISFSVPIIIVPIVHRRILDRSQRKEGITRVDCSSLEWKEP